ncbi:cytochrome P450 3A17 [Colletotrichum truncatum]|uniref:Cytochrome P450 3A17 n=1 Tax=Colletotrichum truncatum TaxID=5467 RepID=A0ACC3ZL75_COLTU|nr:cytochrome P450 3A17 [Colletotrichum truncatum]KAF6786967.1 cytochrome P450 3A17 [Colletotrichum truncatum]
MEKLLLKGLRSPLSHVPGPWHTRFCRWSIKKSRLTGTRMNHIYELHRKYGKIVRVAPNEISCVDLDSFLQVYKVGGGFEKAQWVGDFADKLPALSLSFITNKDEAKERRKLLQKSFTLASLRQNWESEIRQNIEHAVSKIRDDALTGSANTHKWWTLMAADIISQLSFGKSFGMLDLGKSTLYMRAIETALLGAVFKSELPLLHFIFRLIPKSSFQTLGRCLDQVDDAGKNGVEQLAQQHDKTRSLFKEMIVDCEKEDRPWLSDDTVRIEAAGMMVAGSDTTAAVLTYLIWSVLRQKDLQKRLEEEIAKLGDDFDDKKLEGCPLLNAVIEETLRLYPAVPSSLPRKVPPGGVNLSSYFIPSGTVVYSPAYTLHRDPDIFPDPHRFNADRYLNPNMVGLKQRQAMAALGAGARVCLGQHLAMMELRLATAIFFQRCRGATISRSMPLDSMDMVDYVLLSPKRKRCDVTLVGA